MAFSKKKQTKKPNIQNTSLINWPLQDSFIKLKDAHVRSRKQNKTTKKQQHNLGRLKRFSYVKIILVQQKTARVAEMSFTQNQMDMLQHFIMKNTRENAAEITLHMER